MKTISKAKQDEVWIINFMQDRTDKMIEDIEMRLDCYLNHQIYTKEEENRIIAHFTLLTYLHESFEDARAKYFHFTINGV